ncbi:hypothetical protein GCM10016455_26810 [Aliiroseovarius zhejiangensis]|uniref:Uncharacterized protein n=1 Tax=Aliiroseovarius zhejiangensis TaxID=1632025 RepID=A0ABQ3J5A1_9RHOB|nr:hypothetical protein [Aliiroseovarius zhejiangensis]GHF04107.1 hypothetical protein GCM10016455_26810 [Aliiroseovarius zhejiangensis]
MSNKPTSDGARNLDPVDPEYDGRRIVGKLFLSNGQLRLVSKARGHTIYTLVTDGANGSLNRVTIE